MDSYAIKIRLFNFSKRLFGMRTSKWIHFQVNKHLLSKSKIIFVHIPKAAGTSVARSIYGKRFGHFTVSDFQRFLGSDFNSYSNFTVVRNPVDRLISSYAFAIQGGTRDGAVGNRSLYTRREFRSFESFIKEWLVFQEMSRVELIFRPQYMFLTAEEDRTKVLVDHVFKYEQLNEVELYLERKLERTIRLEKKNVSNRKRLSSELDGNLLSLIYSVYRQDFELFGYDLKVH